MCNGDRRSGQRGAHWWIALVALVALVAAACGSSGDTADVSVGEDVPSVPGERARPDPGSEIGAVTPEASAAFMAQAASTTADAESARVHMVMRIEGGELGDMELMVAEGAFSGEGDRGWMVIDMSGMFDAIAAEVTSEDDPMAAMVLGMLEGFREPIEVIVDGDDTYLKMAMLTMFVGEGVEWIRTPTEESDDLGEGLFEPGSASDFLRSLEGAGEVTELGTEEVRGVAATRFSVDLDLDALASVLDDEELRELEEFITTESTIDVWIDDEGLVRRFEMVIDDPGLDMGSDLGANPFAGARFVMTFELFDFGTPVEFELPDPSRVTDADDLDAMFGP